MLEHRRLTEAATDRPRLGLLIEGNWYANSASKYWPWLVDRQLAEAPQAALQTQITEIATLMKAEMAKAAAAFSGKLVPQGANLSQIANDAVMAQLQPLFCREILVDDRQVDRVQDLVRSQGARRVVERHAVDGDAHQVQA